MKWWSSKTVLIIVVLFIGILLLTIGTFYFNNRKNEGFQAATNLCGPGNSVDDMCNIKCKPTDTLPPETDDETVAYDIYEKYNLDGANLALFTQNNPTGNVKWDSSKILAPLSYNTDMGIPWDFDNQTQDPADILWGTVSLKTSQAIFTKCRCQELYGDINNLAYDPTNGQFSYRDPLFQATVYDQNEANALQVGAVFVNMAIDQIFEKIAEKTIKDPASKYVKDWSRREELEKTEKGFKQKIQAEDYKKALAEGKSKNDAYDIVFKKTNATQGDGNNGYDEQWQANKNSSRPTPTFHERYSKGADGKEVDNWIKISDDPSSRLGPKDGSWHSKKCPVDAVSYQDNADGSRTWYTNRDGYFSKGGNIDAGNTARQITISKPDADGKYTITETTPKNTVLKDQYEEITRKYDIAGNNIPIKNKPGTNIPDVDADGKPVPIIDIKSGSIPPRNLTEFEKFTKDEKLRNGSWNRGADGIIPSVKGIDLSKLTQAQGIAKLDALLTADENERKKYMDNLNKGNKVSTASTVKKWFTLRTRETLAATDGTNNNNRVGKIKGFVEKKLSLHNLGSYARNVGTRLRNTVKTMNIRENMTKFKNALNTAVARASVVATTAWLLTFIPVPSAKFAAMVLKFMNFADIVLALVCFSFVAPLLTTVVDSDGVCPTVDGVKSNDIKNSTDELNKSVTGQVVNQILPSIPFFGPIFMIIDKVCFVPFPEMPPQLDPIIGLYEFIKFLTTDERAKYLVTLKINLYDAPYYYDPTLSIYNADVKPGLKAGASANTKDVDARLINPMKFNYNIEYSNEETNINSERYPTQDSAGTRGFPFWVDYASPVMLDKMAQYYVDASRKFLQAQPDGMVTYQYISKFYGLVATTELTCDVQCEITEIKFDPATGAKVCEVVVPMDPGSTNKYHDRRFYFYKDLSKGAGYIASESTSNPPYKTQITTRFNMSDIDRMEDNMKVFVVTACTNMDGTAPDATSTSFEGMPAGNPLVALGPIAGTYNPPIVNMGGLNKLPDQSSCPTATMNSVFHGNKSTSVTTDPSISVPWKYEYIAQNGSKGSQFLTGDPSKYTDKELNNATFKMPDTTKSGSIVWSGCDYTDNACRLEKNKYTIIQQSITGALTMATMIVPARLLNPAVGVQIMLLTTLMGLDYPGSTLPGGNVFTTLTSCVHETLSAIKGAYIINGKNVVSEDGFILDLGPTIDFAPGYKPNITFCSKQGLELYDCVNRYAVRKFIKNYRIEKPDILVKRINSISPRGEPNSLTNTLFGKDTMCVYEISQVKFDYSKMIDTGNIETTVVGIRMKMDTAQRTCSYQGTDIVTDITTIPPIIPFYRNQNEPVYSVTPPLIPEGATFVPRGCTNTNFNCEDPALIDHLTNQFNDAHDNLPTITISNLENVGSSTAATYTGTRSKNGSITYVSKTGTKTCLYNKATFNNVYDYTTRRNTTITRNITFTLKKSMSTTNQCLYDYESDDFQIQFYFIPIPKPSQWFDLPLPTVPSAAKDLSFLRLNCNQSYSDCSNTELMDNLVNQYNTLNFNTKILEIVRAYTPVSDTKVCDYDVQMVRNIDGIEKSILNRETIRLDLKPSPTSLCLYDLNMTTPNLGSVNTGTSLNLSKTLGTLKTPYVWSQSYVNSTIKLFNSYMEQYIGRNIPNILDATTETSLNTVRNLRAKIYEKATLQGCPTMTCSNDTTLSGFDKTNNDLLKRMINRFNFDNWPPYSPTGSIIVDGRTIYSPQNNTVLSKTTIVGINKAGTATKLQCHLQAIVKVEFFIDFLYTPEPTDVQYYLRAYQFDLNPTSMPCKYTIKPFSILDLSNNVMDLSGDLYALQDSKSQLTGDWSTANKSEVQIAIKINDRKNIDPIEIMIRSLYNSVEIFKIGSKSYTNKLHKITKVFNAAPNILEFKIECSHVYLDGDYNVAYYTGANADSPDESYLVATWPEGSRYEVETGFYYKKNGIFYNSTEQGATMCIPTIEEIYFPDLNFKDNKIYKILPNKTEIQICLPYIANDDLTPVNTALQKAKYLCSEGLPGSKC
jgi:hypothetical protein